jgi:hypothetical protein
MPSKTPPPPPAKPPKPRYQVVRDTREKDGQGWSFAPSTACLGTVRRKLDTGDYTIEGLESLFTIDRKKSVSEFAGNLFQERFAREMDRMASLKMAIVMLEFEYEDLCEWPQSSGIPRSRWRYLKVTSSLLQKRFWEYRIKYPHVHFEFVGNRGKDASSALFKRVFEAYGR